VTALARGVASNAPPAHRSIAKRADYPRPPQGGDRRRGLWIARSDWSWGTLDRRDPETGAPQHRYEIAPGTEGIAFGSAGRLWAVSEAGSRHIYDHPFLGRFEPFFPLVFALDLFRLRLATMGICRRSDL
jgi:hypothetical protein